MRQPCPGDRAGWNSKAKHFSPTRNIQSGLHPSKDPKFETEAAQVSQREFCFYPNELPLIPFCCVLLKKKKKVTI